MGWNSYRNWGVPRLYDYQSASNWEANTKPIRGDKNGTKPLGDRKKKYFNIRREGDDIIVKMHSTDIARYKPDGSIIICNGGWPTASTHDMFSMLLGLRMWTFDCKGWVEGYVNGERGHHIVPDNAPMTITSYHNGWALDGVGVATTHKVIRKKANEARKRYAGFKRYLSGMVKLRTETVTNRTWRGEEELQVIKFTKDEIEAEPYFDLHKVHHQQAKHYAELMLSDDPDKQYAAFKFCARSAYGSRWIGINGIIVEPAAIMRFFDKLPLFVHKDECFAVAPIEGNAKRDPYGGWF